MARGKRFFGQLFILIFLGGCSTYKVVSPPLLEEESLESGNCLSSIKKGDQVRITRWCDGIIEGKVIDASAYGLTINTNKFDSEESLCIQAFSIKAVEKRSFNLGKSLLAFGIVALTIAAFSIPIGTSTGGMWGNTVQ